MSTTDPDFVTSGGVSTSQDVSELPLVASSDFEYPIELILETPYDTQPAHGIAQNTTPSDFLDPSNLPPPTTASADDWTRLWIAYSVLTSLLPPIPPPQVTTLLPYNWCKIPQKIYGHGRRQRYFTPSEFISFGVNGRPGVNMGDALQERFTGLDGRDDPVLQDASSAISCRLLVRLSTTSA